MCPTLDTFELLHRFTSAYKPGTHEIKVLTKPLIIVSLNYLLNPKISGYMDAVAQRQHWPDVRHIISVRPLAPVPLLSRLMSSSYAHFHLQQEVLLSCMVTCSSCTLPQPAGVQVCSPEQYAFLHLCCASCYSLQRTLRSRQRHTVVLSCNFMDSKWPSHHDLVLQKHEVYMKKRKCNDFKFVSVLQKPPQD